MENWSNTHIDCNDIEMYDDQIHDLKKINEANLRKLREEMFSYNIYSEYNHKRKFKEEKRKRILQMNPSNKRRKVIPSIMEKSFINNQLRFVYHF